VKQRLGLAPMTFLAHTTLPPGNAVPQSLAQQLNLDSYLSPYFAIAYLVIGI